MSDDEFEIHVGAITQFRIATEKKSMFTFRSQAQHEAKIRKEVEGREVRQRHCWRQVDPYGAISEEHMDDDEKAKGEAQGMSPHHNDEDDELRLAREQAEAQRLRHLEEERRRRLSVAGHPALVTVPAPEPPPVAFEGKIEKHLVSRFSEAGEVELQIVGIKEVLRQKEELDFLDNAMETADMGNDLLTSNEDSMEDLREHREQMLESEVNTHTRTSSESSRRKTSDDHSPVSAIELVDTNGATITKRREDADAYWETRKTWDDSPVSAMLRRRVVIDLERLEAWDRHQLTTMLTLALGRAAADLSNNNGLDVSSVVRKMKDFEKDVRNRQNGMVSVRDEKTGLVSQLQKVAGDHGDVGEAGSSEYKDVDKLTGPRATLADMTDKAQQAFASLRRFREDNFKGVHDSLEHRLAEVGKLLKSEGIQVDPDNPKAADRTYMPNIVVGVNRGGGGDLGSVVSSVARQQDGLFYELQHFYASISADIRKIRDPAADKIFEAPPIGTGKPLKEWTFVELIEKLVIDAGMNLDEKAQAIFRELEVVGPKTVTAVTIPRTIALLKVIKDSLTT